MKLKLPTKFADKNIDNFINDIYLNHKQFPTDKYHFDLTEVEFIGNQELLVLSALFKSFIGAKIDFEIDFFKKGVSTDQIKKRVKRQIIQFWQVWKIWKIVPNDNDYLKYFGIDGNSVEKLQKELDYYPKLSEIYLRHGVTPFISLDYINNYNEIEVQKVINPIYKLNSVIDDLLNVNKCHHPFTSNSLSTIVTEELFLNFLDHSLVSSFGGFKKIAFMSISFQSKIDNKKNSDKEIQIQKELNFKTECLPNTIDFFYDSTEKRYKNNSFIQFSFLDFGMGIVETLRSEFQVQNPQIIDFDDNDILRFAFNHDSSRHPIFVKENQVETFIPRGLFDALTVVRRYNGLLIVRSNYGKIIFDFSKSNDIDKAYSYFGDKVNYFPGTLISFYIPAIDDSSKINVSSIKPEFDFFKISVENRKYISINSIVENLDLDKEILYGKLLSELKKQVCSRNPSLVFISFKGCEQIEKRIIKKVIYFLLSDYDINYSNNVVILNPPSQDLMNEISYEILMLNDAIKNYKLHPLPLVEINDKLDDIKVNWLGIFDESDKRKLNELLYEQYSLAISDFNNHSNISGHLNAFDKYGNLVSNFPARSEILNFYKEANRIIVSNEIKHLLDKHNCLNVDTGKELYLCSGNYFQKVYIDLTNLIDDKNDCNIVTKHLFEKITNSVNNLNEYKFIGVTTTSRKILSSLESQGFIKSDDYLTIDNYNTLELDINIENIDIDKKYILICDLLSTGNLTNRLNSKFKELGSKIEYVAVVVSILNPEFETSKIFLRDFDNKIISLSNRIIPKFKRKDIREEIEGRQIIRINPYTNIPITLSIEETNFNDSIIFHSIISLNKETKEIKIENKFLDGITPESIQIGFYKFNNVIHPYFFNTELILNLISDTLLDDIFKKINNDKLTNDKIKLFYPRKSSIELFDFDSLKRVLTNQSIEEIEIERFGTSEGWRFPHNTDYVSQKVNDNICFILDDGSCSGDSLVQMINEISFYNANEIILLCFVGRVNDHKREFFSRLSGIKVQAGIQISLSIYFASHWHIPTYYLDENPNISETLWLKNLIDLQNIPRSIKNIASNIIKEIKPKNISNYKDYKYLPVHKQTGLLPKKELLLIREEIGKIIGYRFYKESFKFFDFFMQKYDVPKGIKIDRYKEIELLCATFIYEPYIYDKLVGVVPDVVEKIEEFVEVLIFSDQKIYDLLTYKWDKKDIVHLFFIVFKNEKLINKLTLERFKQLITFTQQRVSTINYILYKLTKYFPLSADEFDDKKFDHQIKSLIIKLMDDETIQTKEIKKFYNFIISLPSRDDFSSQLSKLRENYIKQQEDEYHIEKKSFNHNISQLIVTVREIISNIKNSNPITAIQTKVVRKCWYKILDFINPILSFSSSFKGYLLPYTYHELMVQTSELRFMVGFIEDTIMSNNEYMNDLEKLGTINKYITKIQDNFQLNSTFHQLIENSKSNLMNFIAQLRENFVLVAKIDESGTLYNSDDIILNIPKLYLEKLLISELIINMEKYLLKTESSIIYIMYSYPSENLLEIRLSNEILNHDSKNGNGEGIKCIKLMSDSPLFGLKYRSFTESGNYIQILTFNLN